MTQPPVRRVLAAVACAAAIVGTTACGSGADESQAPATTAPAAPGAAPVAPVAVGQKLTSGPATPDVVTRALASGDTMLIAFLANGPADDGAVRISLGRVDASGDVRKFVYNDSGRGAGDLVESLSVVETPTVALVEGDGTVSSRWVGLVDAGMMRQAIDDAVAD